MAGSRKAIERVIAAWEEGKAINGGGRIVTSSGEQVFRVHTDGISVFSYAKQIAYRFPNGLVWLTTDRHSLTTGGHIDSVRSSLRPWNAPDTRLIVESLTLDEFTSDICGHGAHETHHAPENLTDGHCWKTADLMRSCYERFRAVTPLVYPKMKRRAADRGESAHGYYA